MSAKFPRGREHSTFWLIAYSFHGLKVTVGTKKPRRTHTCTHQPMHKPKVIYPSNVFKVWNINSRRLLLLFLFSSPEPQEHQVSLNFTHAPASVRLLPSFHICSNVFSKTARPIKANMGRWERKPVRGN